jgi:fructose-bisphosphate aldolase class 1
MGRADTGNIARSLSVTSRCYATSWHRQLGRGLQVFEATALKESPYQFNFGLSPRQHAIAFLQLTTTCLQVVYLQEQPSDVPWSSYLSLGRPDMLSRLHLYNTRDEHPAHWSLSFSFALKLEDACQSPDHDLGRVHGQVAWVKRSKSFGSHAECTTSDWPQLGPTCRAGI